MRHSVLLVSASLLLITIQMRPSIAAEPLVDVAISISLPAQPLGDSLRSLATQANIQVVVASELVEGRTAPKFQRKSSVHEALNVLLKGTGLEAVEQAPGVVVIRAQPAGEPLPSTTHPTAAATSEGPGDVRLPIAASDVFAEIIVGAQRRAERLQDVPISLTALNQAALDVRGARTTDDLMRLTPGVTLQRNGTAASSNYNDEFSDINIRGIESNTGTSTTGIYIDDTPIQGRHMGYGGFPAFPALFDLERVEVLRGPQGTLFGAGAEGGVVRFIMPEPSLNRSSGYVRTELASTRAGDPSYELGAAFGGPIIDGALGFRISASFRRDGGWVNRTAYTLEANPVDPVVPTPVLDQTIEPHANWQQTVTFRAALKWAISDTLTVTPSVYFQELTVNDTAAYWTTLSNPAGNQFNNGATLANPSVDPFLLSSIKLEWHLGSADLTANTSYFIRHQRGTSNYTNYDRIIFGSAGVLPSIYPLPGYADAAWATYEDRQKNFYQEIRIASADDHARFTWSAGAFFSHLKENVPIHAVDPALRGEILNYTTQLGAPYDLCADPNPCPDGTISFLPLDEIVDTQTALFGEVGLKLTDTVKATAGVRISRTKYAGSEFGGGPFQGPINQSSGASETPVTPRFVLQWQPDPDQMYYASVAKGFRAGGSQVPVSPDLCAGDLVNAGLSNGQAPPTFSSDHLWSYEVGAKTLHLNRRLVINASAFLINWNNIQQAVSLPSCGEFYTANLSKVQSRGGDFDMHLQATTATELQLSVAFTDARFTESSCSGALAFTGAGLGCNSATAPANGVAPTVSRGDRLVGAPWSVVASVEHSFQFRGERQPYVRLDYQFGSAQTALLPSQDPRNAAHDLTIPGLPQTRNLQLRAGVRWGEFDVSLFAQNLLDQNPALFTSRDAAGIDNVYYARGQRPRTIGITALYKY